VKTKDFQRRYSVPIAERDRPDALSGDDELYSISAAQLGQEQGDVGLGGATVTCTAAAISALDMRAHQPEHRTRVR
jgi:hypothetical protein